MDLPQKKLKQLKKNNFTLQEYEVISLKILIDTIDSMVNYEVLELGGSDPDVTVYFSTSTHQKYFYIMLVDFLSKADELLTGAAYNCVELLENISKNPQFNKNSSISSFKTASNIFKSWLDQEVTVDTWLPGIKKQCSLKLKREEFIVVCGNISKHHFARLTRISKKIKKILEKNGVDIPSHDSLLVLSDFYERFHDDILIYYGSNITEMLNNIRWEIQDYLLPEFNMSFKKDKSDPNSIRYNYTYPKDVKTDFAKTCYWNLMNSVRAKPCVKRFESTKYLKLRY